MSPKAQLIYNLLQLENARKTLDQGLRDFTDGVTQEVQSFLNLNLSRSTSLYCDLAKRVDVKCQALNHLLTVLQEMSNDSQFCVKASAENGSITNRQYLLKDKVILTADVLKFGPILRNVILASFVTQTTQVLGATLCLQRLMQFLDIKAVDNDVFYSIKSCQNTVPEITSSSSHFAVREKELVMVKEKPKMGSEVQLPPIIQSQDDSTERTPQLLPTKPISQEISDPHSTNMVLNTQSTYWGLEDNIQVHHQKQTAVQLLHFLRTRTKKRGSVEVDFTQFQSKSQFTKRPQSTTPPRKIKLRVNGMENQGTLFRVKRVESSGTQIYSCMIATKTELWDIGEVVKEVKEDTSDPVEKVTTEKHQRMSYHDENFTCGFSGTQKSQYIKPANSSLLAKSIPLINHASIPEFEIRAFEEMEVVVCHVVDPGNFYIQHPNIIMKQEALVKNWKVHSFAEENNIPDIGTLVMGYFSEQKQWCRARVIKICGISEDGCSSERAGSVTNINMEVMRLDYGDTACLSLRDISYLTPDISLLPLQAIQVSLANVTPVKGRDWSEQAVAWFRAMVKGRTLYARLFPHGSEVMVDLFLEKGKLGAMRRGAPLSLRLVQNGHAKLKVDILKQGNFQRQRKKQEAAWQTYLISCYTGKMAQVDQLL